MVDRTVTEQIVREAEDIEKYKSGLLQQAQRLAMNLDPYSGQPIAAGQTLQDFLGRGQTATYGPGGELTGYTPGGGAYQVAGFAAPQITAIQEAARRGIGAYSPYIASAQGALGSAYTTTGEAADILRGADTRRQFLDAQQALGQAGGATSLVSAAAPELTRGFQDIERGIGGLDVAQRLALQSAQQEFAPALAATRAAMGDIGTARNLTLAARQAQFAPSQSFLGEAAGYMRPTSFTAPGAAETYMSPYMQGVVGIQQREAQRQADIARQGRAAQAARAGAFGGLREGIVEAEAQRNLAQQLGDIQTTGLQSSFQQAQQQYNAEQAARMQAAQQLAGIGGVLGQQAVQQAQLGQGAAGQYGQQAGQQGALAAQLANIQAQQAGLGLQGAGLYGNLANMYGGLAGQRGALAGQLGGLYGQQAGLYQNLGQGIGNLATQQFGVGQQMAQGLGGLGAQLGQLGVQYGALGQTAQQMGQGDINFLYNIGQAQQALNQQMLDAARATAMQTMYTPYQQAAFLSDIYKGAPSTQMATTIAQQPSPSPFQQIAGTAIGGLAAYAGAKRANLFG